MIPMLRSLCLLVLLAGATAWLAAVESDSFLSNEWMDAHVSGHGFVGRALFVALTAAFIALGVPRQIPCFLAGHAFGLMEGFLWASAASLLGSAATFWAARQFTPASWRARFAAAATRMDRLFRVRPFRAALVIRLLPIGHNLSTNMAAGLSRTAASAFLAGSLLGWLPQTVVFALLGSGAAVDTTLRIVLSVALFAVSGLMGVRLLRNHEGRTAAAALAAEPAPETATA